MLLKHYRTRKSVIKCLEVFELKKMSNGSNLDRTGSGVFWKIFIEKMYYLHIHLDCRYKMANLTSFVHWKDL